MLPVLSTSHHNRVQYIDPRLLELTGGGVASSIFEEVAQQNQHDELGIDVDNALAAFPQEPDEIHDRALASQSRSGHRDGTYPAAAVPVKSRQSSLRPNAQEFVPRSSTRPQLPLLTATQEPEAPQQVITTPTTPRIKVLSPADCGLSSNVRARRTSQSRGRARTRSSPARRPSQSLAGRSTPAFRIEPMHGSGNGLLSPIRAEAWITGHSYHPGDRFPLMRYPNTGPEPAIQHSVSGTATSPSSVSSQRTGPFYCDYEDCKQRDKVWYTRSEFKKHQRIHLPTDQRPHGCPNCVRRFQYPKDVARHMRAKHQGGTPVTCQHCNKVLSRDDNLQRHMERLHGVMPTPNSAAQTPSTAVESSVASPSSPSISNCSDMMYSDTSPSTVQTSPWSQVQGSSRSFQQRLLLPAKSKGPLFSSMYAAPTPVPMTRGHTN